MPRLSYNKFDTGISQDDFVVNNGQLIMGEGVDGTNTGYGLTLGPKLNNQFTVTEKQSDMVFGGDGSVLTQAWSVGDGGKVYRISDGSLVYTYNIGATAGIDLLTIHEFGGYYWISADGNSTLWIGYITTTNANAGNWAGNVTEQATGSNISANKTPAVLVTGSFIYFGGSGGRIRRIDSGITTTVFSIFKDNIVGITLHGTNLYVYSDSGTLFLWDGANTSVSANIDLGIRVSRVKSVGSVDYVTSEDGDIYPISGYTVQNLVKTKCSIHLNDNSQFIDKLNFQTGDYDFKTIELGKDDLFLISGDTTKGIYKYGSLFNGTTKALHKIINLSSFDIAYSSIYSMQYNTIESKLYISYDDGTNNGIDYIDVSSKNSNTTGYGITPVFNGGTFQKKEVNFISYTTSNTDGTSSVKLYYRFNNASSWTLFKTINNSDGTIDTDESYDVKGQFIDIQFKIELNNPAEDNLPPILHDLTIDYNIIKPS